MTINADYVPTKYNGNDAQTIFDIVFNYLGIDTNVKVSIKVESTGVTTVKEYLTDYLLDVPQNVVIMLVPPATGETLVLELSPNFKQESHYIENNPMPTVTLEGDIDKRTLEAQINKDQVARSIKFDSDLDITMFDPTIPAFTPTRYIITNPTGDGLRLAVGTSALDDLPVDDGTFYVGNGVEVVGEVGDVARTSMGVGPTDTPVFSSVLVGTPADTLLTRPEVGRLAINGQKIMTTDSVDLVKNKDIDTDINTIRIHEDDIAVSAGVATTILTSNGVGAAPTFQDVTASGGITAASTNTLTNKTIDSVAVGNSITVVEADISDLQPYILSDSVDTLTNKTFDANAIGNSISNIDVEDLADGIEGQILTWGALNEPTTIAPGTSGQVLTSHGSGDVASFDTLPPYITASTADVLSNKTINTNLNNISVVETDLTTAVGTAGQALTSNGVGLAPTYQANDDVVLTSPGNNVRVGGTYPNKTLDVGTSAVGIGTVIINNLSPGLNGDFAVAIGEWAGLSGQGTLSVAIGREAGSSSQGVESVAIGNLAGQTRQGAAAVSVGESAGRDDQGIEAVAVGNLAGNFNQGINSVALGVNSGKNSQGASSVALGPSAGKNSQGGFAVAIGDDAGLTTQGAQAVAVGPGAGTTSQGIDGVAVGREAGNFGQGINTVAVGAQAGKTSQSSSSTSVGYSAGRLSQGAGSVAVGVAAGDDTQGSDAVALGPNAGQTTQGSEAVAVGSDAGNFGQGINAVAVGTLAGETSQGTKTVALGASAGKTTQGSEAVAVGYQAGETTQGNTAVAVGHGAGAQAQGTNSVALGYNAGKTTQGNLAVAVGHLAGEATQGTESVAVGYSAGKTTQGTNAVAVGHLAGETSQGADSVCIGNSSGRVSALSRSVQIGSGCASAGAVGRLAFGSAMEAITPIGAVAAVQSGYINAEWNGVLYRVPAFSATSTAVTSAPTSRAMVKMVNNGFIGRDFAFSASFAELIPIAATYTTYLPADFTNPLNARLKYIGATTRPFTITARFDIDSHNGLAIAVAINGVVDATSETWFEDVAGPAMSFVRELSTNDEVSVWALMDGPTNIGVNCFDFVING